MHGVQKPSENLEQFWRNMPVPQRTQEAHAQVSLVQPVEFVANVSPEHANAQPVVVLKAPVTFPHVPLAHCVQLSRLKPAL